MSIRLFIGYHLLALLCGFSVWQATDELLWFAVVTTSAQMVWALVSGIIAALKKND